MPSATETMVTIALQLQLTADRLEALAIDADVAGDASLERAAGLMRSIARQARNLSTYLGGEALRGGQ